MVFENSQDREECYYVGEDENGVREKQVSYEPIQKVPNSGTIVIAKEDHTVANLLRHQLLSQERVRFAAYQMPHPLVHRVLIRVEVGCFGPRASVLLLAAHVLTPVPRRTPDSTQQDSVLNNGRTRYVSLLPHCAFPDVGCELHAPGGRGQGVRLADHRVLADRPALQGRGREEEVGPRRRV